MRLGFAGIEAFVGSHQPECQEALDRYFRGSSGDSFTGRWFEHFSRLSHPIKLDANDVAACGALSVPLAGKVIDALFNRKSEIDDLLAASPNRTATLWEVDPDSDSYSALNKLYFVVRDVPGIGSVTASKLLASKRPHLVPIRDAVVASVLGAGEDWWAPWRSALTPTLVKLVQGLTSESIPDDVSVLRKLDVILWSFGKEPTRF